jgi:hypothetical protein
MWLIPVVAWFQAELKKGKPAQRILSEFVVKHGGSAY